MSELVGEGDILMITNKKGKNAIRERNYVVAVVLKKNS